MQKNKHFKRHVIAAIDSIKEEIDTTQSYFDTTITMAEKYSVSRNVLQAAFKQRYGISIRDYKLQLRMEQSRILLEQGKDPKQVYLELNYATQSGFTSAFKKYFGITPSESINGYAHSLILQSVQNHKK
jgi:AraC-like DNA-binding protein